MLDLLAGLVDRSLVARGDGPRFRLLETVAAAVRPTSEQQVSDIVRVKTADHVELDIGSHTVDHGPSRRRRDDHGRARKPRRIVHAEQRAEELGESGGHPEIERTVLDEELARQMSGPVPSPSMYGMIG